MRFYLFVINHRFPTTKNECRTCLESHVLYLPKNQEAMKRIAFSFLIFYAFALSAIASVNIEGILYNLDTSNNTAEITKGNCSGSIEIPEIITYDGREYVVTSIARNAFKECTQLLSITLPNSINYLGVECLANGKTIDIHISDLQSWCQITFPYSTSYVGTSKVLYLPIGEFHLFVNNQKIQDLFIPDNITRINANCFNGCRGIKKLTISNSVTEIGEYAFYGCDELESLHLSENTNTIKQFCFCKCSLLTDIQLPSSIRNIEMGAFQEIHKLSSITIPPSVTNIGIGCFDGDTSLSSVIFEDSNCDIKLGGNRMNEQPLFKDCPLTYVYLGRDIDIININYSYKGYRESPFKNSKTLKDVVLGKSITKIGDHCFEGCTNICKVDIPESITSIGAYAFYGCTNLTDINTPLSITVIGKHAFRGCSNLPVENNVRYADKCAVEAIDKSLEYYEVKFDTRHVSTSCFKDCRKAINIKLHDSIIYWCDSVFYNCENLKEANIPNKVGKIGVCMFDGCKNLSNIELPESISLIESHAFWDCESLKTITIPGKVREINNSAFLGCSSLVQLIITDDSKSLHVSKGVSNYNNLFAYCPLEEIYIGRDLYLEERPSDEMDYPFYNIPTLKKITIGNNVTSLYGYSFAYCKNIENIYVNIENPFEITVPTFWYNIVYTCTLHVPFGTANKYKSTKGWTIFKNIVEDEKTSQVISLHSSPVVIGTYDINGNQVRNNHGITILKYRNGRTRKIIRK